MMRFTNEPLHLVLQKLRVKTDSAKPGALVSFETTRPELKQSRWDGDLALVNKEQVRVRGLRVWVDVAEVLDCRLLTPEPLDSQWMRLTIQKLDQAQTLHHSLSDDLTEKYGVNSDFSKLDKREDPGFVTGFHRALQWVAPSDGARVMDLGVNNGDEFALMRDLLPQERFETMTIMGIDYCASAISCAEERLKGKNITFKCWDINRLDGLALDRFDLIISLGTLLCSGINSKQLFMSLIQKYLLERGGVILGFPNCRYVDGEVVFGGKVKNYTASELSLVIKDIYFAKKYLQQHRFKVTLFGKHDLFLAAVRKEKQAK